MRVQLRAAAGLREGTLYKEMVRLHGGLANLLALVEAGIDFSDEEGISLVEVEKVESDLEQMIARLGELVASSVRVDRLDSPPTVVFIGKPNVGVSSGVDQHLRLAGRERAIGVGGWRERTWDMLSAVMRTTMAGGGAVGVDVQ